MPSEKGFCGALSRIRTCDTRFRKPLLYPLSYEGGRMSRTQSRTRSLTGIGGSVTMLLSIGEPTGAVDGALNPDWDATDPPASSPAGHPVRIP
jgi:hypothetical protein